MPENGTKKKMRRHYPVALSGGREAVVTLPAGITQADADKLHGFINGLVVPTLAIIDDDENMELPT